MSQQLNLISEEQGGLNPAVLALIAWAVVVLALFAAWGVNQFRLTAAKASEVAAAIELKEAKATIKQREDTRAALAEEIGLLKPIADSARQFLSLTVGLGSAEGISSYFSTMAGVTEESLWLTKVEIAGVKVRQIEGLSLNNDAVMRYSQHLNAVFADRGVQFSSVDLTSQAIGSPTSGKPLLTSTKFIIR